MLLSLNDVALSSISSTSLMSALYAEKYSKVAKFSDVHSFYWKHSKIQTKRFYQGVIPPYDENGIANSEDPESDLGLHFLPYLYVRKI